MRPNTYCEQCTQMLRADSVKCPNCGAPVIRVPVKPAPPLRPALVAWGLVAAASWLAAGRMLGTLAAENPVTFGPIILPVQLMIVAACAVCAFMGEAGSAPAAPKPAPQVARPPEFTAAQRKEMNRYKLMNRVGMATFLGGLAAGGCAVYSAVDGGRFVILWLTALAPCALVTIVALYGIRSFRCPGCGGMFSIPKMRSRYGNENGAGRCAHCAFDAYSPGA